MNKRPEKQRMTLSISMILLLLGVVLIIMTILFAQNTNVEFIKKNQYYIIIGEIIVFGTIAVELAGQAIVYRFRRRNAAAAGISIRAVLRTAVYLVMFAVIISILAANPAVAVSVGTITGVVVGFASQTVIGNMIAGVLLATLRHVQAGDEIIITGISGKIIEIDLIYTQLETKDVQVFVPNIALMSNVVQKKKVQTIS